MKILKNINLLVLLATIIFSSCKQEAAMEEYQANDTLLTDQPIPAEEVVYTDTDEQDEYEKNDSELKVSESETEQNYSNQENEKESNDEERTLTCQYCDDDFIQKKVIVSVMGTSYETWSGGANHCDPNWDSRSENNLKVNWSGSSKYCSRKCACEAGED